jgi:dTMP kinase
MQKKKYSGKFVSFEGPEGGGKSTQIKKLSKFLLANNVDVLVTREPGGTKLGSEIRSIILNNDNTTIGNRTELLLFQADRAQHIKEIVLPALEKGVFVLCDRFIDSTIAYQVGGRGFPRELIDQLNLFSSYEIFPDLTILLDVEYKTGIKRATQITTDRFENESKQFHEIIRNTYLELAKNNSDRIKIINTTNISEEEVHSLVINEIKNQYGSF